MLQRAASNAYSWWWASHIRTKQSKWMEQNLQDMEEKVQYVLKLIEEDGDSFARRAEMYYKKRPELISFVEESYRAYRALAERYDHISTELQNANNTIASVFPEQVQFAMEDDDDDSSQRPPRRPLDPSKANIPKAPTKAPKEVKKAWRSANKKLQSRMSMKQPIVHPVAKSGLSPSEGLQEIDRLQRNILALQTEKEFVKSSYEGQLAKYQEVDKEIIEMQQKVCSLQDEFGAGSVIEDDEARTLMASAALKSCQDTLSQLEQKHEKSVEEAKLERTRIGDAKEKLNSLKVELVDEKIDNENPTARIESVEESKNLQEPGTITQERKDMEDLRDKIREHINTGSASLTVTEFAEQIDELVNKVIDLEASVSLQNGLIQRMRTDTDDLQTQIGILESDKATLIQGKNEQREKLREMEDKLRGLQELDQNVEGQNKNLKIHFTEAHQNLGELSEKLHNVKPDEESDGEQNPSTNESNESSQRSEIQTEVKNSDSSPKKRESESLPKEKESETDKSHDAKQEKQIEVSESLGKEKAKDDKIGDEPDWKHLYTEGMTEREKFLLNEYTTVLRNYKEAKKQISEASSKNEDDLIDIKIQLKELKTANVKKDELIKLLRNKLGLLQAGTGDESEAEKSIEVDDKLLRIEESEISPVEQKIRTGIDEVLEENLDFWLRFSSTFHQIQKFETEIKDLQSEIKKLEEKQKQEGGNDSKKQESNHDPKSALKSDAKPLYAHLREIQTELSVWLETGLQLKDEVKSRFSSLCHIQEEITAALKESAEDEDFKFTSYQAAKFQGEILNMKQENNKVSDELQAGLDHVTNLQKELEKTLEKMDEEYKLSGTKDKPDIQLEHSESRSRVPLRSFIFGIKPKKQRHSFFSVVSPLQKKYNGLKSGANL